MSDAEFTVSLSGSKGQLDEVSWSVCESALSSFIVVLTSYSAGESTAMIVYSLHE